MAVTNGADVRRIARVVDDLPFVGNEFGVAYSCPSFRRRSRSTASSSVALSAVRRRRDRRARRNPNRGLPLLRHVADDPRPPRAAAARRRGTPQASRIAPDRPTRPVTGATSSATRGTVPARQRPAAHAEGVSARSVSETCQTGFLSPDRPPWASDDPSSLRWEDDASCRSRSAGCEGAV